MRKKENYKKSTLATQSEKKYLSINPIYLFTYCVRVPTNDYTNDSRANNHNIKKIKTQRDVVNCAKFLWPTVSVNVLFFA